jgi:hypothetical protein
MCVRVLHSQTAKRNKKKTFKLCVISGFRWEADENCAKLGYYAASGGNNLTDVSWQPIGPTTKGQESIFRRTDRVSRNVGMELPLHGV